MSWIKKIFGGSTSKPIKDDKPKKSNNKSSFITNSAEFPIGEIELTNTNTLRIDAIIAMSKLSEIAKERGLESKEEVMYTTLIEKGAMTIPLISKMGDEQYAFYFIYNEDDLAKYQDLRRNIGETAFKHLVHFSALPVDTVVPEKKIVEPLQLADIRYDKDISCQGDFAVWWATESDEVFHNSLSYNYLEKINQILEKYGTFLHGYVLRQTRINADEQIKRTLFPSDRNQYGLQGPDGTDIVLEISHDLGIRFYFPSPSTTRKYREQFLKSMLVDFMANFVELTQMKFDHDQPEHVKFSQLINNGLLNAKQLELKGEAISQYGVLNDDQYEYVSYSLIPSWSGFNNKENFGVFMKLVRDYFEKHNVSIAINDGVVKVLDEGFGLSNLGLQNLAQHCSGLNVEDYEGQISVHFNQMIEAQKNQAAFDKHKGNFDFAQEFVSIRIQHESFAKVPVNAEKVTKLIAGDIYAVLCFDLPTTVVSISGNDIESWDKSFDELYELGLENMFNKYEFPISEVEVSGVNFHVSEAQHFYIPNTILDLSNRPDLLGRYGALVAAPTRSLLFIYKIDSLEVVSAINVLIPIVDQVCQKGPGSISSNILWYHEGEFQNFEYRIEEGKIAITPSSEFIKVLEEIGK
ncbi:hypothetical protein [Portibacter lacus]|uniref:Uncharacterized protein n=1 Tax=Portibacter lacus TaxID=1099794 RepID=A0AA37SRJ3_9BACT|nr:hypothetical protein [Portibacter lacus]GLR18592.1 hypothetical protein GCM10007940_32080 [Portibacter lacus]